MYTVIGKNEVCVADEAQLGSAYLSVSCKLEKRTPESCEIDRDHSLSIPLDRMFRIEEVFLREQVLAGKDSKKVNSNLKLRETY